ncbi:MAG: PhzF family phenazine biosynthesis protein [Acidobacteria bacterium]|nr:PhzF family phenazine biosynthesis protein [Acidobacteriota bacterium]
MRVPFFQIDAFASAPFTGNPAAVMPLEAWLPDETLQAIAAENNLAETAFLVKEPGGWRIRWFTPEIEIDLCGHATLASGFVAFEELGVPGTSVTFQSRSGPLTVSRKDGLLELDFPSRPPRPCPVPAGLFEALGLPPGEVQKARDHMVVLGSEAEVRTLKPDLNAFAKVEVFSAIVTAPGDSVDFVSRFFSPFAGVPEDPVTGSAHCTLVPYWAGRLGKDRLHALQVSKRGGELHCENRGERVGIAGRAVKVLEGTFLL